MQGEPGENRVVVFASYKTSLKTWADAGIATRELKYLRLLEQAGGPISRITYGHGDEKSGEPALSGGFHGKPGWMPSVLYSVLSPVIHRRLIRNSDVIRAYQLRGAWSAALASILHRKPFVLRLGYVWSQFNASNGGAGLRLRAVRMLERFALKRASVVICASTGDRDLLQCIYDAPSSKVHVIPNPVDVDRFAAVVNRQRSPGLVTYVGRLESQKRVDRLIDAIGQVPGARLRIIGDGGQRSELEARARGLDVEFVGTVMHEELPALLAESEMFVLPSDFEGTPKALLEAMAAGCAVVATAVEGIEGAVQDEETGLLVDPQPSSIAAGTRRLMEDSTLRERLGRNASRYVSERHSMTSAAIREAELIDQAIGDPVNGVEDADRPRQHHPIDDRAA